jgi:hypothetical protein
MGRTCSTHGRDEKCTKDNVRMDLREIGWEGVNWIHLAHNMDQWHGLVNTVMNLWVPYKVGNFLTS